MWVIKHAAVFTIGMNEKHIEEELAKKPPVIKTDRV